MIDRKFAGFILLCYLLAGCGGGSNNAPDEPPQDASPTAVTVGKAIFFDSHLSSEGNQSCSSCHDPAAGFADPDASVTSPVSEGSVAGQFGNRNSPTAAYASFSPEFRLTITSQTSEEGSKYEGGQFLDGRRSNLVEQAKDPFLNPVEMNNADAAAVVSKVRNASYAADFRAVFGATSLDDVDSAYEFIAQAIAAFETSSQVNRFSSKYDASLVGRYTMTPSEANGLAVFTGTKAKCANCHTLSSTFREPDLFTNFKYFNVGTPVNPANPSPDVDLGLGATLDPVESTEDGKFKVPTLRNIALTAPYMHNGVYETLEQVVTHYDIQVADNDPDPDFVDRNIIPEVERNIASELNTALGLSNQERADLVAFMKTLTDGYF